MPAAFHDLTEHLAAGWAAFDNPGYYVHRGYVYLDGAITSDPPGVTTTIFTGLPSAILPGAPLALTFTASRFNTDWTEDTALQLPLSYDAMLYPNGTLRLVGVLPPQVDITPDPAIYYYVDRLGATRYPRYTSPLSLGIALGTRWAIAPKGDSYASTSLASHLGPEFTDIDAEYSAHVERVHLSGRVRAAVDGAETLLTSMPPDASGGIGADDTPVSDGAEIFDLVVNPFSAFIDTDSPIKPAGESPPLAFCCPPFQTPNPIFGNPALSDNLIHQNFVSVVIPGQATGDIGHGSGLDYGLYTCGAASCRSPGGLPSYAFDLDALMASCDPAPAWFMLSFSYVLLLRAAANDGTCAGGACGPVVPVGLTVALSGSAPMHVVESDGVTPATTTDGGLAGYLAPDAPEYLGDPLLTGFPHYPPSVGGIVWKRGQLTGSLTVTPTGVVNKADISANLELIPLYERRQSGLHAGDVLDLTGAGWPGIAPLLVPGQLASGAAAQGRRRSGAVRGSVGNSTAVLGAARAGNGGSTDAAPGLTPGAAARGSIREG